VNHPERLSRLVLTSCDAFDRFFPPLFRYLQVVAAVPGGLAVLGRLGRFKPVRRGPIAFGWLMREDPPREVVDSWTKPLRDPAVRRDAAKVLRGIDKRFTLDAAERLGSFDKPTLLPWGTRDRVFPLEHAHRLAEILPDARVVPVKDSYAFVPEDKPEELARLIVEFVRDRQPASAG
jgi:pimeloyl-ACP methyl ester carboxylesterase